MGSAVDDWVPKNERPLLPDVFEWSLEELAILIVKLE